MLTKRKLLNYRREALARLNQKNLAKATRFDAINPVTVANNRILELTQELIDQQLLIEGTNLDKD